MKTPLPTLTLVTLLSLGSVGCSSLNNTQRGALIGAGAGGALGAVVAATRPDEAAALRALMPQQILLVPGFGAQGGDADSVRPCFDSNGRGAIVTASRSVIYAFSPGQSDWTQSVAEAAAGFAEQVAAVVGA